ncbi:MAG: hypothetical protein NTV63_04735 [Candidatus Woesearchaeota archaeon]|nr:hypothetical protein [Candidatus Woesearchaeota archaeon]
MALLSIIVIFMGVFIIRPSITGYAVYQEMVKINSSFEEYIQNLDELHEEILSKNTNLSVCYNFNEQLFSEFEKCNNISREYKAKLDVLSLNCSKLMENKNAKIEELQSQIDSKTKQYEELKTDYDLFVKSVADNICCKTKVDNPNIKYYRIENHKVLCLEEGTQQINC